MSDDRERLEQFLAWRRAAGKDHPPRRRPGLRFGAVLAAIGVAAIAMVAWLRGDLPRPRERVAAVTAPQAIPPTVAPAPVVEPPEPAPGVEPPKRAPTVTPPPPRRPSPTDASRVPLRARPVDPRPPARPAPEVLRPPIGTEPSESADVAAAVAPTPPAPVVAAPEPPAPVIAPPEPRVLTPEPTPPSPAPPPELAVEPAPAARPDEPVAAAPPPARVSQRIRQWADGEVQEFRVGVKREIGEFRSGYETVRRRMRDLGSKLRGN